MSVLSLACTAFWRATWETGETPFIPSHIICGIIHLTVRPITRKELALLTPVLLLFMYLYGFYKASPQLFSSAGRPLSWLGQILSPESRSNLEGNTHRDLRAVLMGDLDRSDLQAYLLFRMIGQGSDVELAYGRTYLDGALSFIPYEIFHYRPPGKLKFGTNVVYGNGTYSPTRFYTKIYGLTGETMLNFGPYSAPLGFLLLAAAVGYARAVYRRLSSPTDARRYLVPLLPIACIVCLSSDLDNILFVLLQHGLVPFVLIMLCSSPVRQLVRSFVYSRRYAL